MNTWRLPIFSCVAPFLFVSGCSKGSGSAPTSPTPTDTTVVPLAPASVSVRSVSYRERSMVIDWPAVSGATSYRVLLGNAPRDGRFGEFTTSTPSFELRDLPVSNRTSPDTQLVWLDLSSYVCIQAVNSAGPSVCAVRPLAMPDFLDAMDAIFFSRGQFRDRSDNIPERSSWWGHRSGTPVTIRISSSVSDGHRSAIRRGAEQIADVLPGLYQISIDEPGVSLENAILSRQFVPGQILVGQFPADVLVSQCGGRDSIQACAPLSRAGEFAGSMMILKAENLAWSVQHELGHALLGLGHVYMMPPHFDSSSQGFFDFSWWEQLVMGPSPIVATGTGRIPDRFSAFEVELWRAAFDAGLRPGDSREAFRARGLGR